MAERSAEPFGFNTPEKIATEYGGDKRKIAQAAQLGVIDPTVAVLAGMFIDKMRAAQVQEQQPQMTVAQQVFAPPPVAMPQQGAPGGLPAAPPQAGPMAMPPMPRPAAPPMPPPQAPVMAARGGLAELPIPDDMFDAGENEYAGGGLVAFQSGGGVNLVDFVAGQEGFSPTPYWDNRQYSVGYGMHTDDPNARVTEEEARATLEARLMADRQYVENYLLENGYEPTQGQIDGLTSFVYNLGRGALSQVTGNGSRTMAEIIRVMPEYANTVDDSTGEVTRIPGLVQRRQEEIALMTGAARPAPTPQAAREMEASYAANRDATQNDMRLADYRAELERSSPTASTTPAAPATADYSLPGRDIPSLPEGPMQRYELAPLGAQGVDPQRLFRTGQELLAYADNPAYNTSQYQRDFARQRGADFVDAAEQREIQQLGPRPISFFGTLGEIGRGMNQIGRVMNPGLGGLAFSAVPTTANYFRPGADIQAEERALQDYDRRLEEIRSRYGERTPTPTAPSTLPNLFIQPDANYGITRGFTPSSPLVEQALQNEADARRARVRAGYEAELSRTSPGTTTPDTTTPGTTTPGTTPAEQAPAGFDRNAYIAALKEAYGTGPAVPDVGLSEAQRRENQGMALLAAASGMLGSNAPTFFGALGAGAQAATPAIQAGLADQRAAEREQRMLQYQRDLAQRELDVGAVNQGFATEEDRRQFDAEQAFRNRQLEAEIARNNALSDYYRKPEMYQELATALRAESPELYPTDAAAMRAAIERLNPLPASTTRGDLTQAQAYSQAADEFEQKFLFGGDEGKKEIEAAGGPQGWMDRRVADLTGVVYFDELGG